MAQCLTDGAIYEVEIAQPTRFSRQIVRGIVEIPSHVIVPNDAEARERIHRGLEWALAPYFVGRFVS